METYRTEMRGYKRGSQLLFFIFIFILFCPLCWRLLSHAGTLSGKKWWHKGMRTGYTFGQNYVCTFILLNPVQTGFVVVQ